MSSEKDRIATTEAIFRNVNERIAETAERFDSHSAQFVCECGDQACTHRVEAPLAKYDQVRQDATHFLLAPGHENERVERVVEHRQRYTVVEKFERTVAATVRRLNPRSAT
jgi:hypothetical protein